VSLHNIEAHKRAVREFLKTGHPESLVFVLTTCEVAIHQGPQQQLNRLEAKQKT
jgi:hypothetical protein